MSTSNRSPSDSLGVQILDINSKPLDDDLRVQILDTNREYLDDDLGVQIPDNFDQGPSVPRKDAPFYRASGVIGNYAAETADTDLARLNLAGKDLIGNSELINKIYSNIEKLPTSFLKKASLKMMERIKNVPYENMETFFKTKFKTLAEIGILPFSLTSSSGNDSFAFKSFIRNIFIYEQDGISNYLKTMENKDNSDRYIETELNNDWDSVGGMDHIWNEQDTRKLWQCIYIALKEYNNIDR